MYQTFSVIIDYLEDIQKIIIKDNEIIWIWNPKLARKYLNNPNLRAK